MLTPGTIEGGQVGETTVTVEAPSTSGNPSAPTTAGPAPNLNADILTGDGCGSAETLAWKRVGNRVELDRAGVSIAVPNGFTVTFPRPDVAVLSGPKRVSGARPIIELFNAPACTRYESDGVHRRVAIRAMGEELGLAAAAAAFDRRTDWEGKLAPPRFSIIRYGSITAGDFGGPTIPLVLYYTEIASSPDLAVVFAAACPGGYRDNSTCQRAFTGVISSISGM